MDWEDNKGQELVRESVRREYGRIAREGGSCCTSRSCCDSSNVDSVAMAVGYSPEQLEGLPEGANMGLSCGNPTAIASLQTGEVVLDIGSGGGLDVFIAAKKVAPSGQAIGVDMTADMVARARQNAESLQKTTGLDNAEFRLGEIEYLPVPDSSIDVVISNCVIALSPNKPQVWQEIVRVLKPGGRLSVSDLALLRPLPQSLCQCASELLACCVTSAVLLDKMREMVRAAGLVDAVFTARSDYMDQMSELSDPRYREIASQMPPGSKLSDFVTSVSITARKPESQTQKTCCSQSNSGEKRRRSENTEKNEVCSIVREEYGKIARQDGSCCSKQSNCYNPPPADSVALAVGYTAEQLTELPAGANMGLSCGNPTALALLSPGEIVLDLGSGGGLDIFVAARKLGSSGRAIGVDMTADMVAKARRNAESFHESTSLDNVEFRLGEIEYLPVADNSVDVVISNCVINLSPDKPQVWREIARVLKPGGRVSVSDLALLQPLPESVRESVQALVGCIAGAVLVEEIGEMVHAVGLVEAEFQCSSQYINSMNDWDDPLYREVACKLPAGTQPSDYITSLSITARKPGA